MKKYGVQSNCQGEVSMDHVKIQNIELAQKIKDLEAEVQDMTWTEEAYRAFLDHSIQGLHLLQGFPPKVIICNKVYSEMFGLTPEEMCALPSKELMSYVHPEDYDFVWNNYLDRHNGHLAPDRYEFRVIAKEGKTLWVEGFVALINFRGQPTSQVSLVEIQQRKEAEEQLQKAKESLEERVKERTRELNEMNTALKVLLKKREEDQKEMEEKVLFNMKGFVDPYLEKLEMSGLSKEQQAYMDVLKINCSEIISSFSTRLTSGYYNLTPAEIQVANLVKQGKVNKEIATILNISVRTVETQRNKIRKKLYISNKRINLRSHLLSLQ
jgi:PAS domain S-box-containing protein